MVSTHCSFEFLADARHGLVDALQELSTEARFPRFVPFAGLLDVKGGQRREATLQRQDDSPRLGRSMIERMSRHISIDRDAVSVFCRRHHITRLALFGSVLRGRCGPRQRRGLGGGVSGRPCAGFNFVIEREFSGRLHGGRVDMVTPKFLNPRIRDQVLSSAEPLYVAA
jgi:uncharacterized protein